MNLRTLMRLRNDPTASWEYLGAHEPYFGVVSYEKFKIGNMKESEIKEFFLSGESQIDQVAEKLKSDGFQFPVEASLDFGCGVGRLLLPLSKISGKVIGLDISRTMLAAARENTKNSTNITLIQDLMEIPQDCMFDLIHSYIVFQHMPIEKTEDVLRHFIDLMKPNGICVLHMPIWKKKDFFSDVSYLARKQIKPLQIFYNFVKGNPLGFPLMQMNVYDFGGIASLLFDYKIKEIRFWPDGFHGRFFTGYLIFKKE